MLTYQEVLAAAKNLSPVDQVRLAEAIWDQVSPTDWPVPDEDWVEEVQRRSAQYDAGQMKSATWPEVRARARKNVGLGE